MALQATNPNETAIEPLFSLYKAKLALVFPDCSYSGTDISGVKTLIHMLSQGNGYNYKQQSTEKCFLKSLFFQRKPCLGKFLISGKNVKDLDQYFVSILEENNSQSFNCSNFHKDKKIQTVFFFFYFFLSSDWARVILAIKNAVTLSLSHFRIMYFKIPIILQHRKMIYTLFKYKKYSKFDRLSIQVLSITVATETDHH